MKNKQRIRVLHINHIPVGNVYDLSQGLNEEGCLSKTMVWKEHKRNFNTDFYIKTGFGIKGKIKQYLWLMKHTQQYDILHFHGVPPYIYQATEIVLPKLFGKKVVLHYRGSDLRIHKKEPLFAESVKLKFVSTPDLLKFAPSAKYIPNPINLSKWIPVEKEGCETITIIHNKRENKGSIHVEEAIKKLKKKYKINFLCTETNISHQEMPKLISQADIVLDQFLIGWYGSFAVESMAMKKPVLVYIKEDLKEFTDTSAFINTTAEEIHQNIKELIENEKLRISIGEKGRKYVENVHEYKKVAKQVKREYEKAYF